jgi:hypothetical protein
MVSTPRAPDPLATAQAQGAINKQTAVSQSELNNVNQNTDYGSIKYDQTGTAADGTPQFTATTTLSPELKSLVNSNISNSQGMSNLQGTLLNNASSTLSNPLDLSWGATQANLDKLNRNTLDPQWQQQEDQLQQKLYNQGVMPGSQAYDTAMRNFGQQRSDAYNNMYLQGHQQAVSDLEAQYNSPLNALTALQSGSQVSQPGIGQTAATAQTGIQPANYAGLVQQDYQNQLGASNAAMGGLFGLGGSLLGSATSKWGGMGALGSLGAVVSDRRLKRDIQKVGELANGLGLYVWRYLWGDDLEWGHMADEVEKVAPWAVVRHPQGFLMIDYGAI